jgi:hypothetical protein
MLVWGVLCSKVVQNVQMVTIHRQPIELQMGHGLYAPHNTFGSLQHASVCQTTDQYLAAFRLSGRNITMTTLCPGYIDAQAFEQQQTSYNQ